MHQDSHHRLCTYKFAVTSLNYYCCGSNPHPDEVLRETGSAAHRRQHPCQPGPSPECFQNHQICRGCHIHCPPLSLHTNNKYL